MMWKMISGKILTKDRSLDKKMRQATSKSIRQEVYKYCAKTRHPFPHRVYRAVKKLYLATPRPLRSRFDVATGGIM